MKMKIDLNEKLNEDDSMKLHILAIVFSLNVAAVFPGKFWPFQQWV